MITLVLFFAGGVHPTERAKTRITDISGRVIEQRTTIAGCQVLRIGTTYRPGMYCGEVIQEQSEDN